MSHVVTDQRRGNTAEIVIAWLLTALTVGYFLPWAVAASRGKSNSLAVFLVNLLLGWTLIGWIVALVMACTAHQVAGMSASAPTVSAQTLASRAPVQPRGVLIHQLEVAGEQHYLRAILSLLDAADVASGGDEREVTAVLAPEPTNPHDRNAVRVYVEQQLVGYLSRDDAAMYAAPIAAVGSIYVPGRIWARGQAPDIRARVTVAAPEATEV